MEEAVAAFDAQAARLREGWERRKERQKQEALLAQQEEKARKQEALRQQQEEKARKQEALRQEKEEKARKQEALRQEKEREKEAQRQLKEVQQAAKDRTKRAEALLKQARARMAEEQPLLKRFGSELATVTNGLTDADGFDVDRISHIPMRSLRQVRDAAAAELAGGHVPDEDLRERAWEVSEALAAFEAQVRRLREWEVGVGEEREVVRQGDTRFAGAVARKLEAESRRPGWQGSTVCSDGTTFPLMLHQEACKHLFHPLTPMRRSLAIHPTGTGKTLVMINTLSNYFHDPRPKVVLALLPGAVAVRRRLRAAAPRRHAAAPLVRVVGRRRRARTASRARSSRSSGGSGARGRTTRRCGTCSRRSRSRR